MLSYDFICDVPYLCRNALNSIYEMVDLDSNGSLCRNEFNMYQCYPYDFICDVPYLYRNALNSIYEMVDLDSKWFPM